MTQTTEIHTYQDLVNRILDAPYGEYARDGRNERIAKRAVLNAYRDLPKLHRWGYFERVDTVPTVASQATGTIQYDHTGNGAGERVVLLSGATFPATEAYLYHIIIDAVTYPILEYINSTTVQLSIDSNPGADVAAGSSYTLFRSLYTGPTNLRRCSPLVDLSRGDELQPMSPTEALRAKSGSYQPQTPYGYTMRNAGEFYGNMLFEIIPPPASARTYTYVYEASPRPLRIEKYSTGTVTSSAGTTSIEGVGTAFTSDHVGAIIRLSADGVTEPSCLEGSLEADNPFVIQRSVISVTDSDTLVVDSAIPTSYSAVKYTISDPLDVESQSMYSALEKLANAYFSELANRDDAAFYRQLFERELVAAKIADNHMRDAIPSLPSSNKAGWGLRDWALAEAYGGAVIT